MPAQNRMRSRIPLLIILAVALLARIVFAVGVVGTGSALKGDAADYHSIASNLAAGEGFAGADGKATGRRPPLYPFLLAAVYRVTGPSPVVALWLQVFLGVAVVALVYALGRRHFGANAAAVAAALAAVNPFMIFVSAYLLTENLYTLLVLGALVALPAPPSQPAPRRLLAGAALLGLAALARPTGLPLASWILLAMLLLAAGHPRIKLRRFAVAAAVFLVLTMPWMVRNARVFGGWVGLTTHGGVTFYQGNNEKVVEIEHYRGGVAPVGALPRYEEFAAMGERERDEFTWAAGRRFLRENPGTIPRLMWWKFKRLWRLQSDMGLSGIRSGWWFDTGSALGRAAVRFDPGFAYAAVAFPFFVAGLVITRRRWRELFYLYGIVAVHTALALAFFGSIRSRLPIEPVIALFAGYAITTAWDRWRRFRRRPAGGTPPPAPPPAGT